MAEGEHRAGVVALLGRPNAGKSTLLNHLLGEKLAIVTAKPQTTRSRILGIRSTPEAQILFLDTPGFHVSEKTFNRALNEIVDEVVADCDVGVVLVDPRRGVDEGHVELVERLGRAGKAAFLVATKVDRPRVAEAPWPPASPTGVRTFRVSARTGEGVEALLAAVVAELPFSPSFYPDDELTDRPLRFLVAEQVREVAFELLDQEVPYSLAVAVRSYDESREDLVRIACDLIVERKSQKPIVLGRGGAQIKAIGVEARRRLEAQLGTRVHLELWVKVDARWARKPGARRELGYW